MPGRKAPEIEITEEERQELENLMKAHKTSQQIAFRARIILKLSSGQTERETARQLSTSRNTIKLWRQHWLSRKHQKLKERLQDNERPGAPATFTAEQWCQIMALACEPPQLSDRPISHWTPRELASEAIKRKIVESISERHVGRFLKSSRAKAASKPILA